MKRVRLPRLRCALLGLLPLRARDGGVWLVGGRGGQHNKANEAEALSPDGGRRVSETILIKKP